MLLQMFSGEAEGETAIGIRGTAGRGCLLWGRDVDSEVNLISDRVLGY